MSTTDDQYEALEEYVNFTYGYNIFPQNLAVDWINENDTEFVPMIPHSIFALNDQDCCTFVDLATPMSSWECAESPVTTVCTAELIIASLKSTQSIIKKPMKYLMGYNESYVASDPSKWVAPTDAAEYWRKGH